MTPRHNGAYCDTARCLVCGARFLRLRASRLTCSDVCRQKRSRALRAATPPLPEGPFDLIYADPPWHVRCWAEGKQGGRSLPYADMDLSAICRLPVSKISTPDAVLAIWVNSAEPTATARVIEAWGFTGICEGFVWVKVAKSGKPHFGMGQTTRKDTESVWLAKRGKGLPRMDAGVAQSIISRRRIHSCKPHEAYSRLERLYGDVRRIELFSRRMRPGWTRWGNELLPPDSEPRLPFADGELFEELKMADDDDAALDSYRSWEVGIAAMRERHRNGGAS